MYTMSQKNWKISASCIILASLSSFCKKIIKIGGNLTKFQQKQICTVFLKHIVVLMYFWCDNFTSSDGQNGRFWGMQWRDKTFIPVELNHVTQYVNC